MFSKFIKKVFFYESNDNDETYEFNEASGNDETCESISPLLSSLRSISESNYKLDPPTEESFEDVIECKLKNAAKRGEFYAKINIVNCGCNILKFTTTYENFDEFIKCYKRAYPLSNEVIEKNNVQDSNYKRYIEDYDLYYIDYDFSYLNFKKIVELSRQFAYKHNLEMGIDTSETSDSDGTDTYKDLVFYWGNHFIVNGIIMERT